MSPKKTLILDPDNFTTLYFVQDIKVAIEAVLTDFFVPFNHVTSCDVQKRVPCHSQNSHYEQSIVGVAEHLIQNGVLNLHVEHDRISRS